MSRQPTNGNAAATSTREIQAGLERLERRDWWRWVTALLIMLLLTLGVLSLSLPRMRPDALTQDRLEMAARGLLGLVLIFGFFALHQQVLISRLRRQLAGQIGMLATLEVLKPASAEEEKGRKERRRAQRFPFDQRLKLIAKVEGKEAVFHGRIVDVSELGLGAVISGSLERGDQVLLEFKGAAGDVTFRLRATTRSARGFRHGFQFSELSPPDVQELRRACFGLAETTT